MKVNATFFTCFLLAPLATLHAAAFFVATNGDDVNPGDEQKPLRSIQAALDRMVAGDACILRGGTYREAAIFKTSGEEGKPVRLQAYPGESVVLDGTEAAPKTWTVYKEKISRVSGYKFHNSSWLETNGSKCLKSLSVSSSCKVIFSNG